MAPPKIGKLRGALRKPAVLRVWVGVAFCLVLAACGGAGSGSGGNSGSGSDGTSTNPPPATQTLSQADVQMVVQAAATAAQSDAMAIAVVDRMGRILAVYVGPSAPATSPGNFGAAIPTADLAVALARTGAFFSNDQGPLSSRTVRFISGIHFPPGVMGTANAPLYGIENTNRGCTLSTNFISGQSVPPARSISGATTGLGVATGKVDVNDSDPHAVNARGVPLFRNGSVVGGIGVAGVSSDVAELAAYAPATSNGFGPTPAAPGVIFINGVQLPFVNQTTLPAGVGAGSFTGGFIAGPSASPGPPPEGMLVTPVAGPLGGLAASDVTAIINNSMATANTTRAGIRLP